MRRPKIFLIVFAILSFVVCDLEFSYATPSTTYWTPCTSDVQPFGKWHITYDSYFTVATRAGEKGDFATDVGLTVGALPFEKLNLELGFDLQEPTDNPLSFNAKLGAPENSLFKNSPALNIGIFNAGTQKNKTDYNIVDFIAGKALPFNLGRAHAGYYNGNSKVLVSAGGKKEDDGFMLGFDRYIYKDKVMFAADYASGKNAIGGGGAGLYYFFTKDISLLTGPAWFNDQSLNGNAKWTVQLDINF